jgi:ABC-type amino acid transport substrate-binding protein/cytochrome c5
VKHLVAALISLCTSLSVWADDPHPQLAAGLEAYEFFCAKCHGKDMVNSGVSSYDLRKFPRDQKERFYKSVLEGRGAMPAWGDVIYPEELDALWVYVATRGGKEPMPKDEEDTEEKGANEEASYTPDHHLVNEAHLTACLARNAGAISGMRDNGGVGIDYRVSQALAKQLGLKLKVEWFEGEVEEDSDPVLQTYAMLSYPLCDVVLSHPRFAPSIGEPMTPAAALPRWYGMPTELDTVTNRRVTSRLPHVTLKPITVTAPYMRAEVGLVYREGDPEPQGLHDLDGRRLAIQQGTFSGSIATLTSSKLAAQAITFNPGANFLWQIEQQRADVAIVDVPAYDGHRLHNKITRLKLADWRHALGFDIGVALLSDRSTLKLALDKIITELVDSNTIQSMAMEEGVTYARPKNNGIEKMFTIRRLQALTQ